MPTSAESPSSVTAGSGAATKAARTPRPFVFAYSASPGRSTYGGGRPICTAAATATSSTALTTAGAISPGSQRRVLELEAGRPRGSERQQEDGFQVAVIQGDGIALHAARCQGLGRDLIGMLGADAERGQAGYGEQGQGLADPGQ